MNCDNYRVFATVIQIKVDVVMIMNRNEDWQRLLAAIQAAHDNTILDFKIQRRLIRAVKQLKKVIYLVMSPIV